MDTDIPLKELFRMRARDLLPLTNDAGSKVVLVANPVNVQAAKRAVDFVICLRRGTEEYVRHLEFQARHRAIWPAASSSTRRASRGTTGGRC